MQAIVKTGPGPGVELRLLPQPRPGPGEVVVRVDAVGICGSDMPIIDGIRAVDYPLVPGHEFAGRIEQLGQAVVGWAEGDPVAVDLVVGCGRCRHCFRGTENLCSQISEIGIHRDGAYAESVVVPASCVHRLPNGMDAIAGASVDPLASAYRGIRLARLGPDDHVVVIGAGAIGLYALQAAIAHGVATTTVLVRRHDARARAAIELGATRVAAVVDGDMIDEVRGVTGGEMATVVIEAAGDPTVLDVALAATRSGGRVILIGVYHRAVDAIDLTPVVRREITVGGTICYTRDDFAASIDLLARGLVRPVVSHELPLSRIDDALGLIRRREAVKVVLRP